MNYDEYWEEHRSELIKEIGSLFTVHEIIEAASAEGVHWKQFIIDTIGV